MSYFLRHKKLYSFIFLLIAFLVIFKYLSFPAVRKLLTVYKTRESIQIKDRHDALISLEPNPLGYYAEYIDTVPQEFSKMLLLKEDQYFYYHPGFNPVSILRAMKNFLMGKKNLASSTLTQQLVKILLSDEKERTLKNKLRELYYALALELNLTKKEILTMYCNSLFLGAGVQGIKSASQIYFGKSPEALTKEEISALVSTISNPSNNNPFDRKKLEGNDYELPSQEKKQQLQSDFKNYCHNGAEFEVASLDINQDSTRVFTLDQELNTRLRIILKRNLEMLIQKNASNGAIVAIKFPENELLAIIGSPDPNMDAHGYKINMALSPRPIGSTIKPFIYLKGFEKGLRPYTIVEDKEYKYTIGTGFAFYPKNYDYEYRGPVSLHYALSNSLNVPSVKVLEYVGIENFNNFLLDELGFTPVQDLNNYQLGIALGELEMDLLTLSRYFTIFVNQGELKPLRISSTQTIGSEVKEPRFQDQNPNKKESQNSTKIGSEISHSRPISSSPYIQLINKILSDRITGIEQFGETSDLNLQAKNYAVKTGTSREYHDSWVMGYTPDFLVGVWVGNSEDTAMDAVSGQSGAGKIWHEAMDLMLNSPYNKKTSFTYDSLKEFPTEEGIDYGFSSDNFEKNKNLLLENNLILNPHDGDTFLLEKNTAILLKARKDAEWKINGTPWGKGQELIFSPHEIGEYVIEAGEKTAKESVKVFVETENE